MRDTEGKSGKNNREKLLGSDSPALSLHTHILYYNSPLLSVKVHHCCITALWGGQAKGGDEWGGGGEGGEMELMTGRKRGKKESSRECRSGEDTKTSGKSFKCFFFGFLVFFLLLDFRDLCSQK